ncbi:hypothetical protein N9A28_02290 [Sulfurimonas sp.]|nr:hypothetical protein [Sulfurimonas sp.]
MSKLFISLAVTFILVLTGCSTPKRVTVLKDIKRPSWVLNPNQDDKTGAIGVASRTHDQKISTQRKIAISRALEELSLQQNVQVTLSIKKNEKLSNNNASIHMDVDSTFNTSSNITAHIESAWMNDYTSELYIWMVLD